MRKQLDGRMHKIEAFMAGGNSGGRVNMHSTRRAKATARVRVRERGQVRAWARERAKVRIRAR
jgi:hypothetical protein